MNTETTRICPFPFPIWKTCTESIQLTDYDGRTVQIDQGTKLILPVTALHHHPDYFVDSEEFNPDRFLSTTNDAKTLKDAGIFTPFGNGPRICMGMLNGFSKIPSRKLIIFEFILGMRWAVLFMKLALSSLVDKFDISMDISNNKPSFQKGMLFFSSNDVQLKLKRIE